MATPRRLGRGITVGLCIRRQGELSEGVWDQDLESASLLGKGRQPIQVVVLPVHRVEVHARCLVDSGGFDLGVMLLGLSRMVAISREVSQIRPRC